MSPRLRLIGELSAALLAGIAVGRERRAPNRAELERFRSRRLGDSFRRGIRRGRREAPPIALEQLEMLPTGSPTHREESNATEAQ